MDQGNGVTEVLHPAQVDTGIWHNVTLSFSSDQIHLEVDGQAAVKKPMAGPQRYIDLTDR